MRWRRALVWTGGGLIALVALLFAGLQTGPGQRALASLVSSAASSADSKLEISGLSGFFPTDLRVAKVELSDRKGVWLKAADARISWSFASLFSGRLRVEQVAAGQIEVLRAPQPGEQSNGGGGGLPTGIDLAVLSIDDLHVGAPLGGVDSHWKLSGSALLATDAQSHLKLEMNRSDGPTAHLHADIGFGLDRLNVDGDILAEESTKGGVIAALIDRPDLDKVSLRLVAKGDRGDGTARLDAAAGDAVTANGAARWHRNGGSTAISLDIGLVGPGLPDSPVGRLLRSPAKLSGEATLDDAGLLIVQRASFDGGPAKLNATARYDTAADELAVMADLRVGEAGPLADLAGGVTWRDLHLNAKVELSGLARKPRGAATLTASVDDVVLATLVSGAPPPGHVDVNAKLGLQSDGRLVIEAFDAQTDVAAVKLTGAFMPSTRDGGGKLVLDLPDLARFSTVSGVVLGGRAHLDLSAHARNQDVSANWQGTLDDLSLPGLPPGLARQAVRLSGGAALQRDQSWRLDSVRMVSDGFTVEASGHGRQRGGEIDLKLALPRLGVLQDDVGGSATANGKVVLKPAGGDLHLTADLAGLSRGGIASRKLALALDASLDGETMSGSVKASGDLANQPVALDGRFVRKADGGLAVPSLHGSWASAAIDIKDLAVTPTGATGNGHIRMAHLEDLAPLLGTDLGGGFDLQVATEPDPAGKVTLVLRGDGLHSGGTGAGNLQIDATVTDPLGSATTDATIKASRLSGVAEIGQVNATVKGDRSAIDLSLQAMGARTSASLAAKVEPTADEIRATLQRFEGRYQAVPLVLAAPAHIKIAGAHVAIEGAAFRLGGGRLGVSGAVDQAASDLTLEIAALPLTLLEAFAPGSGVEGTLQAKLHVTGPLANPHIQATYAANGLRIKRPETALLPALALQGTADVAGAQATFDAKVTAGGTTNLGVKGKATIPQGKAPLAATIALAGTVDIAPFSPSMGNDMRGMAGALRTDLTLNVRNTAVSGSGTMSLSGAALSLPASGLRLSGGQATLALQGDTLQLQKLSFQTARNGEVSATGTVRLEPAQGFPVDIAVTTRKALLANRPDLLASVSSDIKVTGSSSSGFNASGNATIDQAEIAIGVGQAANYPTLPVREINGTGPRDPAAPPPAAPKAASATPIRLALTVRAPQAVFVRGRGLNAEVGGQFTVTGDPARPAVLGNMSLRRGDFNLLGHRLSFTRGNVSLVDASNIDPLLDFAATTTVNSTSIEIDITGTSRVPKIAIISIPDMPQDEAMALLLFGKPASSLSPFELLSAAQAVAELTGSTPVGGGFMGKVRSGLGLDNLSINSSSNKSNPTAGTTTSVEGGRYVSPGVYVGARQGASGDSSHGVVEIEVLKHTKLTGDIGADSTGKVGAKMEWDY